MIATGTRVSICQTCSSKACDLSYDGLASIRNPTPMRIAAYNKRKNLPFLSVDSKDQDWVVIATIFDIDFRDGVGISFLTFFFRRQPVDIPVLNLINTQRKSFLIL